MLRIFDIILLLGEGEDLLPGRIAELLAVPVEQIEAMRVVRRSLDARRERPPRFVYVVDISLPDEQGVMEKAGERLKIRPVEKKTPEQFPPRHVAAGKLKRPIVVGSGPAGLFAALTLVSRGVPTLLLERGKPVRDRVADTASFWSRGILNPESNVHFGEGGAGTFSDGKLTTRLRDERLDWVKRTFVDFGAPGEILAEGKPHIGTDRLRDVVVNLRKRLIELGCVLGR